MPTTSEAEAPAAKRAKTEGEGAAAEASGSKRPVEGVVSPTLLASGGTLAEQYQNAQPYKHCVMTSVFDVEVLKAVREEIIHNINATYKETDLFKVFQTGDLGNLDRLDPETAAKLPALMKLKAALYSEEFRALITSVTGCGDLTNKTDCSCNVYAHGGHLLCHDDVIGTRRVSWIIYLTDPEDAWTKEDGGALELYPRVPGGGYTPEVHPTVCHLPLFNTMAMFTVTPGVSFHSVAEVMSEDKPRMSISGWYHADKRPAEWDKASLEQLQMKAGEDASTSHVPYPGGMPAGDLSEDDLSLLVRYINPAYLNEEHWPKVQAKFKEDGSVQLKNFLRKGLAEKITAALVSEDASDGLGGGKHFPSYEVGVRDGWCAQGPPHKQRFLRYGGASSTGGAAAPQHCGALLQGVLSELFTSPAFARLLTKITTIGMTAVTGEVRRFRPGLDYTVAHYGILTKDPRLDVVLTFVDDATPDKAGDWDAGEVGGFEAYLLAEEEEEKEGPADTYRVKDADESGVLNVSAACNTLNLVLRDEGLMRFVKYVSYAAPSSRWDIAMEYVPEEDSDDEEEEGDEEKEEEEGDAAAGDE